MAIDTTTSVDVQTLTPFKKFIMTIGNIPTSYLESMSYAELLMWFCNYLQNTVIPTVNNNGEAVEELQGLYEELKTYINEYFDNLDVQEEINNKLDTMAQDGSLMEIIKPYIDPIFDELNERIDTNADGIITINSRIDEFTSLTDGSTSGDAELADIRVAENGFTYSSAGSAVRNQVKTLDENISPLYDYIQEIMPTELGSIDGSDLEVNSPYSNRIRSAILYLDGDYIIECNNAYQLNIYEKTSGGTTSFKVATSNGRVAYTFDDTSKYRIVGQKIGANNPSPISFKLIKVNNIKESLDNLNNIQNDIDRINESDKSFIKKTYNVLTLSDYTLLNDQFYNKTNGNLDSASGSQSVKIPVKPGEKYRVTGLPSGNLAVVCYFDANSKYVTYGLDTGAQYNIEITIPDSIYFITVQTRHRNTNPITVQKYENDYTYTFDIISNIKRTAYIDNKLPYSISTLDKGYITISVDDGNSDIDVIAKTMQTDYSYPLNLALPPSTLHNAVANNQGIGNTVLDIAKYVEEHNGEILSHSFTVITSSNENDFDIMYNQFSNNKRILEDNGLNVNGIILTGGTGEISDSITNMWARGYYNYSDRYGQKEPFYNPRTNIAKTALATVKQAIDDCASDHTLLHLCFHGLYDYGTTTDGTSTYVNGFTLSDLKTILDYIKTYTDNSEIAVVRYGYVYDNFGSH